MCGGGCLTRTHKLKAGTRLCEYTHGWEGAKLDFSINQKMFDRFMALSGASFETEA